MKDLGDPNNEYDMDDFMDEIDDEDTEEQYSDQDSRDDYTYEEGEEMIFRDIPLDYEDQELVDVLDDAISDSELENDEYKEYRPGYKFTQQELIRLKADFDSDDPEVKESARQLVYNNYRGLVHFVMKSYYSTYIAKHHDDLVSQGNVGIMTGFKDYDPMRNGQFYQPSTILTRHIRHEMRTYIAEEVGGTTTKYHSTGQKMLEIIRRKRAAGEEINPGDIANELGISLKTARHSLEAITINSNKISLDDKIKDGETTVMEVTPSKIKTPEEAMLEKEYKDSIRHAMDVALNPIQRKAMYLKFGFDGYPELTMAGIAKVMDIKPEHMRGILASATTRLKQYMSSNSMFASEHKERSSMRTPQRTQRTTDDLKRELESLDFSTLDDIDF